MLARVMPTRELGGRINAEYAEALPSAQPRRRQRFHDAGENVKEDRAHKMRLLIVFGEASKLFIPVK